MTGGGTAHQLDGAPEPDGETVIVINHWRYAGTSRSVHVGMFIPDPLSMAREEDTS